MGDRGNVYITDSDPNSYQASEFQRGSHGIYVYSHWDGHVLPRVVQVALAAARGRWSDDQYLTRILIDQITKPGRDQETGYGIGLKMGDNSYPITVVDVGRQEVAWALAGNERNPLTWAGNISFSEFVKIPNENVGYPAGVRM